MGACSCTCLPAFQMTSHRNVRPLPARFTLTDYVALDFYGLAGGHLTDNLVALQALGHSGHMPLTGIDGFNLPEHLLAGADVIVAGSPHGHDPSGNYYSGDSSREFKQNLIYSLQHHTRCEQTVIVTYGPRATGRLELWADPDNRRVLLQTRAYFRTYRPRRGMDADLAVLSHSAGCLLWCGKTMLSMFSAHGAICLAWQLALPSWSLTLRIHGCRCGQARRHDDDAGGTMSDR